MAKLLGRRKNKKDLLQDEWGEKGDPYKTTQQSLDDYGVYEIRGFSQRKINIMNWLVKGIITLLAVIAVLVAIMPITLSSKVNTIENRVDSMQTPAFKSRYDDLGKSIIQAYYSHQEPPVNLMSNISWAGYKGEDNDTNQSNPNVDSAPIIVNNLSLIRSPETVNMSPSRDRNTVFTNPRNEVLVYSGTVDGVPYEFSISLIIPDVDDPTILPYLASPPVMMPAKNIILTNESDIDTPSQSDGYNPLKLNEFSLKAISDWASAYAQDDTESLKRITGDQNAAHVYHGLGGFSLEGTPTSLWSFQNSLGTLQDDTDDFIISRVQFRMVKRLENNLSNTQREVLGERTGMFVQTQTFDLMLRNFSSGTPNVVAWGPAGTWSSLSEFGNATELTQEDVEKQSDQQQTEVENDNPDSEVPESNNVPTLESQQRTTPTNSSTMTSSAENNDRDTNDTNGSKKSNGKKEKSSSNKNSSKKSQSSETDKKGY